MKKIATLLLVTILGFTSVQAQSVDEILNTYFENIGGLENFKKLKGLKMTAKVNNGGMEIPVEMVNLKDGRQYLKFNLQGKQITQMAYDGETMWSTNFQTQKAEKSPKEATDNFKLNANDFPDPFVDYKKKGYTVELMGKENIDGAEAFKIKLVKEPITVDGKKEEDVSYYFFDADNFVPIAIHSEIKSGPMKGQISEVIMSDYQEVDGLYFAFSMKQGVKGQGGQPITITKIELNPTVDDDAFKFPTEEKK